MIQFYNISDIYLR